MDYNDQTAKIILETDLYPDGANTPTEHIEYKCPCGKGKIIYENVRGFDDSYAFFKCKTCEKKYDFVYGCGYYWELEEK